MIAYLQFKCVTFSDILTDSNIVSNLLSSSIFLNETGNEIKHKKHRNKIITFLKIIEKNIKRVDRIF